MHIGIAPRDDVANVVIGITRGDRIDLHVLAGRTHAWKQTREFVAREPFEKSIRWLRGVPLQQRGRLEFRQRTGEVAHLAILERIDTDQRAFARQQARVQALRVCRQRKGALQIVALGFEQDVVILPRYRAQHSQQVFCVVVRRRRNVRLQYGHGGGDSDVACIIVTVMYEFTVVRRQDDRAVKAHPYCIVVSVSAKALTAIIENGGRGAYRDDVPWLIAAELLEAAHGSGATAAVDRCDRRSAGTRALGNRPCDRRR